MIFFNVFFRTLGFLSALLIFVIIINLLLNFSNGLEKKQFVMTDGMPNSNNIIANINLNGPIFNDTNFKIRNSALTRLNVMQGGGNGYSIKSERYRLTKWGEKGELGYELYDHKNDKEELINLAENKKYYEVLDSLKKEIDKRITQARQKPKGLGRQLEQRTYDRIKYTPGDIHDIEGKRIFLKPKDE